MLSSHQKHEAASWGQDVTDMWMTLSAEACVSIRSWKRLRSVCCRDTFAVSEGGPSARSHVFGVFQVAVFSG